MNADFFLILVSLGWASSFLTATPAPPSSLSLRSGFNETIRVPKLSRAAVGDEKVVRVRALPPDVLLITARKPGKTMVRAWGANGEVVYPVEVLAIENVDSVRTDGDSDVIRIALEFIEVSGAVGESLGIRWPDAFHFSGGAGFQGDGSSSGLNYSASITSGKGLLGTLVRRGLAKILARPELFVRTGEEASFHSGGEYPVAYSTASQGSFHRRVDWKPYGLTIKVRPRSTDQLHIQSDVALELSELNHANGTEGIPSLTRRKLDTKTNSLDGETIILSGLLRQSQGKGNEGTPLLSDLPLIGSLFGQRTKSSEESELFMTVTYTFTTREKNRQKLQDWQSRVAQREVN